MVRVEWRGGSGFLGLGGGLPNFFGIVPPLVKPQKTLFFLDDMRCLGDGGRSTQLRNSYEIALDVVYQQRHAGTHHIFVPAVLGIHRHFAQQLLFLKQQLLDLGQLRFLLGELRQATTFHQWSKLL